MYRIAFIASLISRLQLFSNVVVHVPSVAQRVIVIGGIGVMQSGFRHTVAVQPLMSSALRCAVLH
jgi:hypothetical protein